MPLSRSHFQSFVPLELRRETEGPKTPGDQKKRREVASRRQRISLGARQPLCGYATIVVALLPPSNFVNVTLTRSPTVTAFFMTAMSVRSKL
jgi:hypothetical protein